MEEIRRPVIEHTQPLAAFSGDMLELSEQYLDCFVALDVKSHTDRIHPSYFLIHHSTELALKAFLAYRGLSYRKIVEFNHKIRSSYVKSIESGLIAIPKLDFLVDRISDMNVEHSLRYPAYKFTSVPDAEECAEVVRALISIIGPDIRTAATISMLKLRARYPGCDFVWVGDPEPLAAKHRN